jgi:hypothetical protein
MEVVTNDVSLGRQRLRRQVNERIGARAEDGDDIEIFCECGRRSCSARIRVAAVDYAAVLARDGRVVVVAEHSDRLVDSPLGYLVVSGRRGG